MNRKYFILKSPWLALYIFLVINNVKGQNNFGLAAPENHTGYHSEYKWLSPTKVEFTFYTQRNCYLVSIFANKKFPDTCFFGIYVNNKKAVSNILAFRDSIYSHPYNTCAGISDCFGNSGGHYGFSIFRYRGTVDFNNPAIKDTLDKLKECMIDIVFMGGYRNTGFGSNFVSGSNSPPDNLYGYMQINRCFKWKTGDRSPSVRMFQPFSGDNLIQSGIQQIDLGYKKGHSEDSLNYLLTQPRIYPTGAFYALTGFLSLSYYYPSYCPAGAPCIAAPNANPPRGFYLSPKTGIAKYYKPTADNVNWNPIMAVECESYKKDSLGKQVKVSSLVRINTSYNPYSVDNTNNKYAYTTDFDYTYNSCEEIADTFIFNIKDSLAKNQTIKDTVNLKWIHDLPGAVALVTNPGKPEPNIKIIWTPPAGSHINNPYTFNVYAHEKLCDANRRYMFRSAEFYAVPKPKFKVNIDTTLCSQLKFSATTTQTGSFKLDWAVFNMGDTIKISSKLQDSINIPYPGKWLIQLKVQNTIYGCTNYYLDSVLTVNAAIISNISSQKNKVCKGEIALFSNSTINNLGNLKYRWFRNGSFASDSGTYATIVNDTTKVRVLVSDKRNCSATDSILITTFPAKAIHHLPDTSFCNKANITIQAVALNSKDTITWLHNNSHVAKQTLFVSQNYMISYKDSNTCRTNDTFNLREIQTLLPEKLNDTSLCKNDTIKFVLPLNPNISYDSISWYKDAILASTNYNPSIAFSSNSVIRLHIFGNQYKKRCEAKDTIIATVFPKSDIKLNIRTLEECIKNNMFEAGKTGTTATKSATIDWGDLSNTEAFITGKKHSYSDTGNYLIRLFLYTSDNCRDTTFQSVSVLASPKVDFVINDSDQCLKDNNFKLTLNSSPSNLKHTIDWGNNSVVNNVLNGFVNHIYPKDSTSIGIFYITVSTLQGNSCKDTIIKSVQIIPNPSIKIKAKGFCIGDSTHFTALKLNAVNLQSVQWMINNTPISSSGNFSYLFAKTGTYPSTLQVVSDLQCSGKDSMDITILSWPKAFFDFAKTERDQMGIPFFFNDLSTHATNRLWTIDNSYNSTFKTFKYTFTDTGFARVKLLVSNQQLCYDSFERIVPVVEKIAFYIPNAFSPNDNGINDGFGISHNQAYLVKEFYLQIYNRWGEKVFETKDVTEHWQPTKIQQGIYVIKIQVRDIYNILQDIKGVVEVLK